MNLRVYENTTHRHSNTLQRSMSHRFSAFHSQLALIDLGNVFSFLLMMVSFFVFVFRQEELENEKDDFLPEDLDQTIEIELLSAQGLPVNVALPAEIMATIDTTDSSTARVGISRPPPVVSLPEIPQVEVARETPSEKPQSLLDEARLVCLVTHNDNCAKLAKFAGIRLHSNLPNDAALLCSALLLPPLLLLLLLLRVPGSRSDSTGPTWKRRSLLYMLQRPKRSGLQC